MNDDERNTQRKKTITDKPDELNIRSHDIADDERQELLRLFPEIRTEGGKLDLKRLKLELGEAVDEGKERYSMTWPGKAEYFRIILKLIGAMADRKPERVVCFDEGFSNNDQLKANAVRIFKTKGMINFKTV